MGTWKKFTGEERKTKTLKFDTAEQRDQFADIMTGLWQNCDKLIAAREESANGKGKRRMTEHEDSSLGQYQSDSSGLKSVCVLLFFVLMFAVSVLILFRG